MVVCIREVGAKLRDSSGELGNGVEDDAEVQRVPIELPVRPRGPRVIRPRKSGAMNGINWATPDWKPESKTVFEYCKDAMRGDSRMVNCGRCNVTSSNGAP